MRAICLDLTRLTRRAALPQMTGIDRVELAYLKNLLGHEDARIFGLVRARRRLHVLDRAGMVAFLDKARASAWGRPKLGALFSRRPSEVHAAEASVARLAVGSRRIGMASEALRSILPPGVLYINSGHSNLDPAVFGAIVGVPDSEALVVIHDTIPLDFPEFQRPNIPTEFKRKLEAATVFARRIVVPSSSVASSVRRHSPSDGHTPEVVVSPLGVELEQGIVPSEVAKSGQPYFVSVGTIEPRKNHALLLDLWESLPGDHRPPLYIVGRRGWRNEAVFSRLDRGVPGVTELSDVDDDRLTGLVANAAGLLHPSFAEGFGLPPHEAASLGVVPVCSPIAVFKETLGETPIYASPDDLYQWTEAVMHLSKRKEAEREPRVAPLAGYTPPTWDAHFKVALTTIC